MMMWKWAGWVRIWALVFLGGLTCCLAPALSRRPAVHPAASDPVPLRPGEIRGPSVREVDRALNGSRAADWIESYDEGGRPGVDEKNGTERRLAY